MSERGRAYHRFQQGRAVRRAYRILHDSWGWPDRFIKTQAEVWHYAKRMANNMKLCSGACCCNPRRSGWVQGWQEATMQERRNLTNL